MVSVAASVHNSVPAGDAWHYAKSLRVALALGHPAHPSGAGWDLETVEPSQGPFNEAYWWIANELGTDEAEAAESASAALDSSRGRLVRDELEATAYPEFEAAARHAILLCDQHARLSAMRMNKSARFFTYAALLGGHGGRIEQLISTCPAVLTLAAVSSPHSGHGLRILDAVRAGRKLGRVIELALEGTRQPPQGRPQAFHPSAPALVRAGGDLPILDLMALLRAPGLDINDLPAAGTDCERWVNVMATWSHCAVKRHVQHADQLGRFLSRHALEFVEGYPECTIEILLDWVERSGSPVPSRRSSARRVLAAIDRWHRSAYLEVSHPPETRLAPGPIPSASIAGMAVTAIGTVGELQVEAYEMQHCVSSLVEDALAGRTYLYRAVIAGARVTIAIAAHGSGWYVQEAAGVANRQLELEEQYAVQCWVRTLR